MPYTRVMVGRKNQRPLYQRVVIDIAGFGLMIISPFLGWLPGPGGIPLFLAGLGLVSLNHEWAERLLKDFDKKRVELTDKYLMASRRVSISIDIFSLAILGFGVYLAATSQDLLWRGGGLFMISITLIILLSNQKRFERIFKFFKKK